MSDWEHVIAIDGPSGSGKSTVAKLLAEVLNLLYIDTGAMYRGLGYYLNKQNISKQSTTDIVATLADMKFEYGLSSDVLIQINAQDMTPFLRDHQVSKLASEYSQVVAVRQFLLKVQRELPGKHICVMEGRDIGSVIFPNAFAKFYITADLTERAQRRFEQIKDLGQEAQFDQVLEDVKKRDKEDSERDEAPLVRSSDAEFVDTTGESIPSVVESLAKKVKLMAQEKGIPL